MSERKKRKVHDSNDKLMYMHLLEEGASINYVHEHYGIGCLELEVLWKKYQSGDSGCLAKNDFARASAQLKRQIVRDIEKNHLTLCAASLKYNCSIGSIRRWCRISRNNGLSALGVVKKRGRQKVMGRPRKNSKPLTELEKLRKENQELKTEIALLKKVRALVEERKARLRGIGHGPSKD